MRLGIQIGDIICFDPTLKKVLMEGCKRGNVKA
jgi:hypothetical protein